jgi:TPP-dependent pyruvate/acetoin dehydrogenase alpha subunit
LTDLENIFRLVPRSDKENPLLKNYIGLRYIREVESLIASNYNKQQFRCPVHLSIGQEAVAAGICSNLRLQDKVVSTHRSHAHYLAKGGSLFRMFAELMGSSSGCCGGRGGSMHLFDDGVGFIASIPIVGSSTPIAAGLAYAEKRIGEENIVVSFVGDAVLETGVFYETMNLAGVKNLPLLIVIEDNGYSTYADKSVRIPKTRNTEKLVQGFGLKFMSGNGDDLNEVVQVSNEAIKEVRNNVPFVLYFETFRRYEHCGPNIDDSLGYRSQSELDSYALRDPLKLLKQKNLKSQGFDVSLLDAIDVLVSKYVFDIYQEAVIDRENIITELRPSF